MANKILKVLVIGDTHDSPHIPDKSRFGWFAKHIKKTKPDEIYTLAAQSHVAVSFEVPEYTANADALGALRILEAIKFHKLHKTKF